MKYMESMIAWRAASAPPEHGIPAGSVRVGPYPDRSHWSRGYPSTIGACFASVRKASKAQRDLQLFLDFHTLVVRDGLDPQRVHAEFLKIDEYRALISPDTPGAMVGD